MFEHLIGQDAAKLAMTDWYKCEEQPLLIYGPSGYGKTAFAEAMGARTVDTTQFRGDRLSTILKPIKEAEDGDILFLDEIHALQPKILEGLYKIIDKGVFYDPELCMDLPIPKVKFIFATNMLSVLPEAFINRCKFVELVKYNFKELQEVVHLAYPEIKNNISIIRASKGVPRTALSLAKSVIAGIKAEAKTTNISEAQVNRILQTRFNINISTGLNQNEFLIIQKVIERGQLSTTAVANLLRLTIKDAQRQYIEPLRASDWLAVNSQGVIPGVKAHADYRLFKRACL